MLSDDKISHLSHVLLGRLMDRDVVDILEEESVVRRAIRKAIVAQVAIGMEMDDVVRRKIASLSRHVPEGSPEWQTLYQKYLREEETRRGMSG